MRAVNLIPADQRGGNPVGAGRSGGAAYAVMGLLAGAAVLALLYGKASHEVSSDRSTVASLQQRVQQAQTAAGTLAPYTSFVELREQRRTAVESLVASRFDWAHVFHEFGRVLPATANISSLTGAVGGFGGAGAATVAAPLHAGGASAATSATPPGSVPSFTLTGCATSQTAVADTINRLRLMDGVSAVTLQSSTQSVDSSSGAGGGCGKNDPAYTVQVTFQPLPPASAVATGVRSNVADASASAPTAGASTGAVR